MTSTKAALPIRGLLARLARSLLAGLLGWQWLFQPTRVYLVAPHGTRHGN